jgi:hypothetical protein
LDEVDPTGPSDESGSPSGCKGEASAEDEVLEALEAERGTKGAAVAERVALSLRVVVAFVLDLGLGSLAREDK